MFSNLLQSYPYPQEYTIPKNWGFITDNHIHNKIHEYFILGISRKLSPLIGIISMYFYNQFCKKSKHD